MNKFKHIDSKNFNLTDRKLLIFLARINGKIIIEKAEKNDFSITQYNGVSL